MTDLLKTPMTDRTKGLENETQDYELEGVDFFSPIQAMGSQATKEVAPEVAPELRDEPYEAWGFGD